MNNDFIPLKADSRPGSRGSRGSSSKPAAAAAAAVFRAPRALLCHICGRQTLIAGYEHHIKQCAALFEKRQALLPPNERRKLPPKPEMLGKTGGSSRASIEEHNELAMRAMASTMAECEHCGRTFLPDKLAIHHRSCTAATPARRVGMVAAGGRTVSYDMRRDDSVFSSNSTNNTVTNSKASLIGAPTPRKSTAAAPILPAEMQQCAHCGRSFNEVAYLKHTTICLKVFVKKRKPFDAAKHRLKDLMPDVRSNTRAKKGSFINRSVAVSASRPTQQQQQQQQSVKASTKSDWRAQSDSLRQAMKLARMVGRAEKYSSQTGIPLHEILPAHGDHASSVPDPVYANYVTCLTCNRRFNEQAGARHIPQCKSILAKPSKLFAHSGEVATKYSYKGAGDSLKSPRKAPPGAGPNPSSALGAARGGARR